MSTFSILSCENILNKYYLNRFTAQFDTIDSGRILKIDFRKYVVNKE
ncbi:hypothetical protein SSCHL_0177 [Staphylococcus schleiferi]|nr:hypothetical protein SSCHL_0177 [Staphylococcus schleiferi]